MSQFAFDPQLFHVFSLDLKLSATLSIPFGFLQALDAVLLLESFSGEPLDTQPLCLYLGFLLESLQLCDPQSLLLGQTHFELHLRSLVGNSLLL